MGFGNWALVYYWVSECRYQVASSYRNARQCSEYRSNHCKDGLLGLSLATPFIWSKLCLLVARDSFFMVGEEPVREEEGAEVERQLINGGRGLTCEEGM